MKFQVVYSDKQVAETNQDPVKGIISPSARKPKLIADALRQKYPGISFVEPDPLSTEDFYLAHEQKYVDDIFSKRRANGFGTKSDSVNASLPYTSGAMFKACQIAQPDCPAAALVAGFHHVGYAGPAEHTYFCTFNGLMIAALKMIKSSYVQRVTIIDCDLHFGDGTDNIIKHFRCSSRVQHYTFGRYYNSPKDAELYLALLEPKDGYIRREIQTFRPDLIIYQSGADTHIDDPMGGILTEEEMIERDVRVFQIAKDLKIPVAWCLAGGYQVDKDGGIGTIVRLHLNTFDACERVNQEEV